IVSATARAEVVSSKQSSGVACTWWLSETSSPRLRCTAAAAAFLAGVTSGPAVTAGSPARHLLYDRHDVAGSHRVACAHTHLLDHPVLLRRDGVLHLHRLQQADGLADLDDLADRHEDLDDRALHGDGHLARAVGRHRRRGGTLGASGGPTGSGRRAQVGYPQA